MSYFVLRYDLVDDYLERRAALREKHLGLAKAAFERGELLVAGALAEPRGSGAARVPRAGSLCRRGVRPS